MITINANETRESSKSNVFTDLLTSFFESAVFTDLFIFPKMASSTREKFVCQRKISCASRTREWLKQKKHRWKVCGSAKYLDILDYKQG